MSPLSVPDALYLLTVQKFKKTLKMITQCYSLNYNIYMLLIKHIKYFPP